MKQIAVLAMLIMAGVLAHGQTLVDAHIAKGVVSCEKRNWPFKDPVCDGYALAMAHQFYQEHPEYFDPAQLPVATVTLSGIAVTASVLCPEGLTCDAKTGKIIPLQCGKYKHEEYTPSHCADTCDPYRTTCEASCLFVAATDTCVDDTHTLTEREWQEVLEKLKELAPKK